MRRLVAVFALASSSLVALAVPVSVNAANIAPEPEMIARKLITQTSGPSGFLAPNDVMPWGLDRIDSRTGRDNSFTYTTDGTGVKAYIVDSGVNAAHPEFSSRVLPGWSYRSRTSDPTGAALASYNNAISLYNTNPAYGIPPCAYDSRVHQFVPSTVDGAREDGDVGRVDNDGHGTHVAGVIGGLTTGVAKGVTIVPVRVLDSCGAGTTTMVLSGLNWILADHQPGEKAVINMSIGFESTATSIDTAIRNLLAEGIVVVAASGNDGGSACGITPAGTLGTISVGASNANDGEPYFTSFGECVDIFAPGQTIVSSWPWCDSVALCGRSEIVDTYKWETGTSMAAPHVAGAVARYLQSATVTATTPADAWNWLRNNATCNAVTYYAPTATEASRTGAVKTPNRLLAVEAPATVPCAPGNITAATGSTSSVVTWEEVPAGNGSAITAYTATASPGGKSCTVPSGTTCTITGLTAGTKYSFSVTATNSTGVSTQGFAENLPDAPQNVKATAAEKSAVVSWDDGTSSNGYAITAFTATATPGGKSCTVPSGTTCTITDLVKNTKYSISVTAKNRIGVGPASTTVSVTPGGLPGAVTSLVAATQKNALDVSWVQADGDGAEVTYTATATPGGGTCTSTAAVTTKCSITGLVNGTEYTVSVIGANAYGSSTAMTATGLADGVPDVPASSMSTVGSKSVTVTWSAITSSINVTYVVTSTPGNLTCSSTETSCVVTGLKNGVNYTFTITTKTATGQVAAAGIQLVARPGFIVKKSIVKKGSTTPLSWLITSLSTGKKTWSETGPCALVGTKLKAPKASASCVVTLKVAKKGKFPAMSTRLRVTVE
jgi:subtilisin family serine protease